MSGSAEQGQRFLHENAMHLATLTSKEGKLDFEGYKLAETADTLLSGMEGYIGSIAAGSDVRAYHGTTPSLEEGQLPDRDVIVVMQSADFIPDEDKENFSKKIAREIGRSLNSKNPIDCTVTYFNGADTVHQTIDNLTGMFTPDHWWLYIFSQAAFGTHIEAARNIVREELKHFPEGKRRAVINGFTRLITENEKLAFYKYREGGYHRFQGVTDAQIEESFQRRRELWAEQFRQTLQIEAASA